MKKSDEPEPKEEPLVVGLYEARPNKMFTEEQRATVRFLRYNQLVACSECGPEKQDALDGPLLVRSAVDGRPRSKAVGQGASTARSGVPEPSPGDGTMDAAAQEAEGKEGD